METLLQWGLDPDTSWWTALGLFLGGGGACLAVIKMFDKIVAALMKRSEDKEIRKEKADVLLREELRQESERRGRRIAILEAEQEIREQRFNDLFRVNVALETENRLLRGATGRMRAYLMYQQDELRKSLGMPEIPIHGIPAWIDDSVPGPTADQPTIPISSPVDIGKKAMTDDTADSH